MSARMFLVPAEVLRDGRPGDHVVVDGPEGRHARTVVRLAPGDHVLLGDGAGRRAVADVVAADRRTVTTRILRVEDEPAPPLRFVLVQALARGDRDEQAVTAATELGVDRIVPWQAARSVVRWDGPRAGVGRARWEALAGAATKQARRSRVPVVDPVARRREVEDLLGEATLGLVLSGEGPTPLGAVALPPAGSVVLVVGPEGGVDPGELDAFAAAGGVPVRLGREVLRTSTAGPAALAVLAARTRWA